MENQLHSGACHAGGGPASFGAKRASSSQPEPAIRRPVTTPGSAIVAQLVPGTRTVVSTTAKERGDHGRTEAKPRWIARSMRRVRWRRMTGSGSEVTLPVASPPSSAIAP